MSENNVPAGYKLVAGHYDGQDYVSLYQLAEPTDKWLICAYERGNPNMFAFLTALAAAPVAQPPAQPAESVLPHPGGVEISALLDSILAEYNWPSNPKNAARAGWTAAMRYLATQPLASRELGPYFEEQPDGTLLPIGPDEYDTTQPLAAPVQQTEAVPFGYARVHCTPDTPMGYAEYDTEMVEGDCPIGKGWFPLYATPPTQPALPPVARVPLTDVTRFDQRVIDLQEKAFMPYAQALELAASEFGDILCWVHEWGAIGLPLGHPSRVTCFAAFNTLAEAVENAVACEFNDRILPVFQPTESDLNEYPASRRTFIQSDAARPVGEVVIGPKGDVEGWTVVRWGDDGCPPIGTKLYTHGIEASTGEQSHG